MSTRMVLRTEKRPSRNARGPQGTGKTENVAGGVSANPSSLAGAACFARLRRHRVKAKKFKTSGYNEKDNIGSTDGCRAADAGDHRPGIQPGRLRSLVGRECIRDHAALDAAS